MKTVRPDQLQRLVDEAGAKVRTASGIMASGDVVEQMRSLAAKVESAARTSSLTAEMISEAAKVIVECSRVMMAQASKARSRSLDVEVVDRDANGLLSRLVITPKE